MTTLTETLDQQATEQLRHAVRGTVTVPGDSEYDSARAVWNGMIDRRPAALVGCAGVADVRAAILFARERGLTVAVRGGGHHVAGFGTCEGGIVIDLGQMNGVRVNLGPRTALVGGGARWADVDHETQAFGLATTGGVVSATGVGGLTLGGGIGWLMRKHGLTCDNLVACDLVTADGSLVRASAEENPELLWALRGGGGNFGVVTAFEFRLHPVGPAVYGGATFYPVERMAELLDFCALWMPGLPDEATLAVVAVTAPPAPFIPPEYQGRKLVAVAGSHIGPPEQAAGLLQPLKDMKPIADLLGPLPYPHLQSMFDAGAPAGMRSYWKTAYLESLSPAAIASLVEAAESMPVGLPAVHLHHLQGEVARVPGGSAAFAHRDAAFAVNLVGIWPQPSQDDEHIGWVRASAERLRPAATGGVYLNFSADGGDDQVKSAFGAAYERLAGVKAELDPDNVFHVNQNIRPALAETRRR